MAEDKEGREKRYTKWIAEGRAHLQAHNEKWPQWLGYLQNIPPKRKGGGKYEYRLFLNLVYNNLQNLRPALYFQDPKFEAKLRPSAALNPPMKLDPLLSATMAKNALHYYVKETGLKQEVKLCLVEALLLGVSFFKQGYHTPTSKIEAKRSILKQIRDAMDDVADKIAESVKKLEAPDLSAISLADIPDKETWWGRWASARDILIPRGYGNRLWDAPWVIHRILKRRDEAIAGYPDIAKFAIEPTYRSDQNDESPADTYEIYELWDWLARKVIYLIPELGSNSKRIVKEIDWPKGLEKYPFLELKFSEIPGEFYAQPDLLFYEDVVSAVSEVQSNSLAYLRRYKAQYWRNGEELSEAIQAKFQRPVDGRIISGQGNMPELIPPPQLPSDAYNFISRSIAFLDQLAGMTEYQRGGPSRKRTATEAQYMQTGLQIKLDEKRDIFEDFLGNIGRVAIQLIRKNMSDKLVVELSPAEAQQFGFKNPWREVSSEIIDAEFDIWVVAGSTFKEDSFVVGKRYSDAWQLSAGLNFVNAKTMWADVMVMSLGLAREQVEKWMLPDQDPDAVKLAQLENAMAMMGRPLDPPDPNEMHPVQFPIHMQAIQSLDLQAIQGQLQVLQQQAQGYLAAGQPVPNDLNMQIQQAGQALRIAPQSLQILQQHAQIHQQHMQQKSPINPVNYNLLHESEQGYAPGEGGSTNAEQAGEMMA